MWFGHGLRKERTDRRDIFVCSRPSYILGVADLWKCLHGKQRCRRLQQGKVSDLKRTWICMGMKLCEYTALWAIDLKFMSGAGSTVLHLRVG